MVVLFITSFFGARELIYDISDEWYGSDEHTIVACTADAMLCPDGSAVGRTGPNCEFAACPAVSVPNPEPTPVPEQPPATSAVLCDSEDRPQVCTKEYRPVCGLVQIECITTPCNPIPETFGNACSACSQGNVLSYTEGACKV